MKPNKYLTLVLSFTLLSTQLFAQKDFFKGKVSDIKAEDLKTSIYSVDSSASAVFLFDLGTTTFEGNENGWFNYVFRRAARIKILNKNGFDAAVWKILLYQSNNKAEVLSDLKAITYNLENEKVTKTLLGDKDVFETSINKNYTEKKFTLSAVKEGSIIEVSYTITSPYVFSLQPWAFQDGQYPRLLSEYQVGIPAMLNYFFIKHGVDSFYSRKSWQKQEEFAVQYDAPTSGMYNFGKKDGAMVSTAVNYFSWIMKDVPAFKAENFITAPKNYINALEFQLSTTFNGESIDKSYANWNQASQSLLNYQDFGGALQQNISIPAIDKLVQPSADVLTTAQNIYTYIKNNFSCTEHNNIYVKAGLQNVIANKHGTVGEINLLLINILRKHGITADPVILSTREHGFNNASFPILNKYNYVICKANIDGKTYFADAAQPNLGFGDIASNCYNGEGIVIKPVPAKVLFSGDSLQESKVTSVFVFNGTDGLEGTFSSTYGKVESFNTRNNLSSGSVQNIFKNIKAADPSVEMVNMDIESLHDIDMPITAKCNLKFNLEDADIVYFNPIISEGLKQNSFKAATRLYPVEMPYCTDETYLLNMEIPTGYMVDEMPKSTRIKLNENDGFFEYIIGKAGNNIQLRCRFKLNKANFTSEHYQSLKDFVAYAVKMQAEQIVFKKIK